MHTATWGVATTDHHTPTAGHRAAETLFGIILAGTTLYGIWCVLSFVIAYLLRG